MPEFCNTLDHPVRPSDGRGGTYRILPGEVIACKGELADALTVTPGVEEATSAQKKRWESVLESRRIKGSMPGDGSRIAAKGALGPARNDLRMAAVAAPLQRVVGDDSAPHGPASGTITTRNEAGTSGEPGDREAFLQNDVVADEGSKVEAPGASEQDVLAGRATQSDIYNAQVDNAIAAEAAAQRFVGGGSSASSEPVSGDYADKKNSAASLQAEANRRGLEVEGTGASGGVKRSDLVGALEADDESNLTGA